MKAALLYGRENIRIEEIEKPSTGPGDVLIKVLACGICGSDKRMYFNGPSDRYKKPVILGHEIVGEIVETGERVILAPTISCGVCSYCINGDDNLCNNVLVIGANFDGGFAEYFNVPEKMVNAGGMIKVRSGSQIEAYTFKELAGCCINGLRQLKDAKRNDKILILGDGPTSYLIAEILKNTNDNVYIAGKYDNRIKLASKFNAIGFKSSDIDKYHNFFDVIILANSDINLVNPMLETARKNASILLFSGYDKSKSKIEIDLNLIHYKQLHVHGTIDASLSSFDLVSKMIYGDKIVDLGLTKTYGIDNIVEAFYEARDNKEILKVVINPWVQ